jgi:hypothetical protein
MEISVAKLGRGVQVTYGYRGARGYAVKNCPSKIRIDLLDKWSIVFGAPETQSDEDLTKR